MRVSNWTNRWPASWPPLQSGSRLRAPSKRHLGQPTWFGSLQLAPAESIARHLKHEHPQIIAVVLAHLPAKRSAEVVKQLPERQQADVLRRVADSDAADPQVLHELECELERRLSGEIRAARARSTGLNAVVSILNAAGEDREEWIKKVSEHDESLLPLLGTDSDTPADSALPITRKSPPASSHPAAKRQADSGSPTRHATDEPVPGPGWNAHAAHGASHTASTRVCRHRAT